MFEPSKKPTIFVRWKNGSETHQLSSNYLHEWPLFKLYDAAFLDAHRLPSTIVGRDSAAQSLDGTAFSNQLEQLIKEVDAGSTVFTHFTVIRNRTFNKKLIAGSLTLKSNDYPFVVKLFIESPYSFVHPFKKGWESLGLFLVASSSRFLTGFTRIKNLQYINEKLAQNSEWLSIGTPRKWFWTPHHSRELEITGYNFGHAQQPKIVVLPRVYCIISDAIDAERENSFSSWKDLIRSSATDRAALKQQSAIAIKLFNYLEFCIDLNVDNFITQKNTKKLFIIDTEHFPTLAGLFKKPAVIASYPSLGLCILRSSIYNVFFRPTGSPLIPFDIKD